jgi:DNA-directed RNA polymerase specialized sigma subunit
VRVIEYALPGQQDATKRYRLLSSLLDPDAAPAKDLAALYHERWEVEGLFDELKTHLIDSRRVFLSKAERNKKIAQAFFEGGHSQTAIARAFEVSGSTVSRVILTHEADPKIGARGRYGKREG